MEEKGNIEKIIMEEGQKNNNKMENKRKYFYK